VLARLRGTHPRPTSYSKPGYDSGNACATRSHVASDPPASMITWRQCGGREEVYRQDAVLTPDTAGAKALAARASVHDGADPARPSPTSNWLERSRNPL